MWSVGCMVLGYGWHSRRREICLLISFDLKLTCTQRTLIPLWCLPEGQKYKRIWKQSGKGIAARLCVQYSSSLLSEWPLPCCDCQGMAFTSEQQQAHALCYSGIAKRAPKGSLKFSKPGCLRGWPQLLSIMVGAIKAGSSNREKLFCSWEPWLRKGRL